MNPSQNLINQINRLTTKIETQYPEIYHFIEEQPITIPSNNHCDTNDKTLLDYLDSLRQLLEHHLDTHRKNPKIV
ncbi:hypothetical protein [Aquimarina mytili]|uniref:Uncharacterized protein n=1 Tax=Aquimarina mytili TaxID=874423 RepID=A0A936ZPP6_9FLAO|nr:hypothetical protein [Aquimarina mytili]MBL0682027.1 hypothetical protein [Aquimarina mytili]